MRPCGTYFDQKNISNKHQLLFSLGLKFLKLSVKDILATGLLYIYKIFVQVYFVGYVNSAHFFFHNAECKDSKPSIEIVKTDLTYLLIIWNVWGRSFWSLILVLVSTEWDT